MPAFLSKLSIVIVNYNLGEDTVSCINSLIKAGAKEEQIIVVDNQSTDNSVSYIRERFGHINIIVMPDNRGYPHALNTGVNESLNKNFDWILLLNNDIVVDKDFLMALEKAVLENREISLFSPAIYYYDEPDTIWYLSEKVIVGTLIGVRYLRNRKISKKLPLIIPTDFLNGCAMLVHRKVFENIGLFNDDEFIYGDDPDFSWRAKRNGFKAASVPDAKMWHKVSKTMKKTKPNTRYLKIRNTIRFYKKHAKGFVYPIMILFTFARILVLSLLDLLQKRSDLVKAMWKGWLDGWLSSR
ncbi:MAG: rhamnosyltransferase [Candidatus Dojkabacteria bacterium]|nr:MAG: rhamnosyltransferase [Bellilinea sp.]GIW57693.1 MAG: rhamnosyltransferase [Candidatus Dojkabacteria bacterium]